MYRVNRNVHSVYMRKRTTPHLRPKSRPKWNFIRAWREFRGRTLMELAETLREVHGIKITHASLSRIERGLQPYSQPILEALAAELTGGDEASLLIRHPSDPDGIWQVWDNAQPADRRKIIEIAKTIIKTD